MANKTNHFTGIDMKIDVLENRLIGFITEGYTLKFNCTCGIKLLVSIKLLPFGVDNLLRNWFGGNLRHCIGEGFAGCGTGGLGAR